MTKNNIMISFTLLSTCVCLLYFLTKKSDGTTDIQVKETKSTYSLQASFNPKKMSKVTSYLNSYFAPEGTFYVSETFDKKIILKDKTTFQLETSAGEVEIMADKRNNSANSIERIRKMGVEIKDIIMQE